MISKSIIKRLGHQLDTLVQSGKIKFYKGADIRGAANIVEVAIELGLDVQNNKCRCFNPENHESDDATPSMTFNVEKGIFKCWVCDGIGGSVIDLAMQKNNWSYAKAQLWLGHHLRLEHKDERAAKTRELIPKTKVTKRLVPFISAQEVQLKSEMSLHIMGEFMKLCPLAGEGRRYIEGRGISFPLARAAGIGFCANYETVSKQLIDRFGFGQVKAAGLSTFYQYAAHKLPFILFPYMKQGTVHYIKARTLASKEKLDELSKTKEFIGRFKNTHGSIPFPYLMDKVCQPDETLYIVEGEIKALAMSQHGYQAIGIPGSNAFKKIWLSMVHNKSIIIIMDNDKAGRKAAENLTEDFLRYRGIKVRNCTRDFFEDLDEVLLKQFHGGTDGNKP